MNRRVKDALGRVGIEVERYYVGNDPYCFPPVWGIALVKGGHDLVVIESHGCHTEDDRLLNKYVTRSRRAHAGKAKRDPDASRDTKLYPEIAVHRTQREAVAAAIRRLYAGIF